MYKTNLKALETLNNYSVCVKTKQGIRNMRITGDINKDLVYVNNCLKIEEVKIIQKDEYCRYIDLWFIVKAEI